MEIFHQALQLITLTSNLLNQDVSQYAYKTPTTTICGSGNLYAGDLWDVDKED